MQIGKRSMRPISDDDAFIFMSQDRFKKFMGREIARSVVTAKSGGGPFFWAYQDRLVITVPIELVGDQLLTEPTPGIVAWVAKTFAESGWIIPKFAQPAAEEPMRT